MIDTIYAHARRGAGDDLARTAAARKAVACILWRHSGTGELSIYVAQRAASLAFMGGFWTFPGGAVEPDDDGPTAAAAREIREELGIALPAATDAYIDAGRWVTPEFAPIRFDTTYYLVELPASADPDWRASGGELEDGRWVAPAELLERWRAGDWLVPTPVLRAVRALIPGIDGAAERCREAAAIENASPRVWDLVPGIGLVPLRSPTLPPATHTNCYLFGTGEMIAVDPATPYPDEQAALDRALDSLAADGRRLVEIWLTHHHLDHVSGAVALAERAGVPIAAHPETAARLAGRVPVDRELTDGETRELAGPTPRRLRALFTPGHAPGHLCFVEETTGFVAAGDMVAGVGTILVDPSEGDMALYLDSLRLLRDLGPRVLLPAHGHAISAVTSKLDGYVAHRLWREERVARALADAGPASASELVPAAYSDVPRALYPLAERSLIAHLVKLEADGVAARDGELWRPAR